MSESLVLGLPDYDVRMCCSSKDIKSPSSRLGIESEDEYDSGICNDGTCPNNCDRSHRVIISAIV